MTERVIAYIDGFNLYYGLKTKGWRRFYWLDVAAMCAGLLKSDQELVATKYFTARVASPADKVRRQGVYLEALGLASNCEIYYGQYLDTPRTCPYCGRIYTVPKEKMTDLLIGLEMFSDAVQDQCDTMLLVSGDSDLVAAATKIRGQHPDKRIVVAFPPARHSRALAAVAHASFVIGRAKIAAAQMPLEVPKADGYVLRCPRLWRPEETNS